MGPNGGSVAMDGNTPVAAEFMDPFRESISQLKVGLKGGMSHTPPSLQPHFNTTLKLALTPAPLTPF
jgi:hypothetical protein